MEVRYSLYCLRDKVSGNFSHFMLAENDSVYVRELVAHRVAFPMNFDDFEPLCLMEFDIMDFDIRPVDWTAWRAPESEAELLAPLGCTADEISAIIARKQQEKSKEDK